MGRPTKNTLKFVPSWRQWVGRIGGKMIRLGTDEDAARRKFDWLCRQSGDAPPVDPHATLGDVAASYVQWVAEKFPGRKKLVKEQLTKFVLFADAATPVHTLKAKTVDEWIAQRELADGTIRLYKAIILACLNWAARPLSKGGGEMIHENPLRGKLHLPETQSRGAESVWTKETFDQVCYFGSDAFVRVVKFLAWTGCRPSLLCRLEARHYNAKMGRMDVIDLAQSRKKLIPHLRLNDGARLMVEELVKENKGGKLFKNSFGGDWRSEALQIYLTNLMKKFKETKKLAWQPNLTVYGLRHTFATAYLAEFPNEIEYLRVLLGHKDYKMILKHYGHLVDGHSAVSDRLKGFDPFKRATS